MTNLTTDSKAILINNVGIISGIKASENALNLLTNVVENVLEIGIENTTIETLQSVKIVINDKAVCLTEKQASKVIAGLEIVKILGISDNSDSNSDNAINVRKAVDKPRRESRAVRFTKSTSDEKLREISRLMAEWRIVEDGSRPLSWKNCRAELGLENEEFHKVIRPSKIWKDAVIARIKELRVENPDWKYVGKLEVLTGIDGFSEADLV